MAKGALPIEIWRLVYEFDPTYRELYNNVIEEVARAWMIFAEDIHTNEVNSFSEKLSRREALATLGHMLITGYDMDAWVSRYYPSSGRLVALT